MTVFELVVYLDTKSPSWLFTSREAAERFYDEEWRFRPHDIREKTIHSEWWGPIGGNPDKELA